MAHELDTASFISLPVLGATSALSLASALDAAAEGKKLSPSLMKAKKAMATSAAALEKALKERLGGAASPGVRAADQEEDAIWAAIRDWLNAFARIPEKHATHDKKAVTALEALFPDGLSFTPLPVAAEWAEAETRVSKIAAEKLEVHFHALGGGSFLKALHAIHAAYGKALGITSPVDLGKAPAIRKPLAAGLKATKSYVLKVVATVEEDDPKTGTLAKDLLVPLPRLEEEAPGRPKKKGGSSDSSGGTGSTGSTGGK
ncbi:hypothetical protein HY251_21025 [bacterium]|nr:hypothetical protein [bacterium]